MRLSILDLFIVCSGTHFRPSITSGGSNPQFWPTSKVFWGYFLHLCWTSCKIICDFH